MPDELTRAASTYAERLNRYNVIAVVENLERAREALNALSRAGIQPANTSLLGPAAERARAETLVDPAAQDGAVIEDVVKASAVGSVAGGAAGGAAGFLAGLAAFAIPGIGPAVGTGMWISTLGGAVLGSGVGGVLGGVSSISSSDAWALSHQVQKGHALVGVHSDDAETVRRARDIVADLKGVLDIGEFDENGKRIGS
jgi:hypothetical protein